MQMPNKPPQRMPTKAPLSAWEVRKGITRDESFRVDAQIEHRQNGIPGIPVLQKLKEFSGRILSLLQQKTEE